MTRDNIHPDDDAFVARVRDTLDASPLDPAIAARLSAARRRAVAQLETPRAASTWIPLGAAAAVLMGVALAVLMAPDPSLPLYESASQELAAADLELLEDLEFIAWMIEAEEAT